MQLTLLSVTQSYLNRTSGFYVDSIFDTDESQQVAQIAEEVFYSLIQKVPHLQFTTQLGKLDASLDTAKPNYLKIPSSVSRIQDATIEYNCIDTEKGNTHNYNQVKYLHPTEFLSLMRNRNSGTQNTTEIEDYDGTKFLVVNNRNPQFCTSFNGEYLVFDAYDADEDSTLQQSKSRVLWNSEPVFLQSDSFVIPIPEGYSELYRDLVLVECYESLRQEPAPAVVQRRAASRVAAMQQMERRVGSMHNPRTKYGRR